LRDTRAGGEKTGIGVIQAKVVDPEEKQPKSTEAEAVEEDRERVWMP